jgi:nucleoside-diphosphate-sugar epimerase
MNIKILILGSNGFFGKNLKKSLRNDIYEYFYLERKYIDILNKEQLQQLFISFNPNIVINCCGMIGSSKSNTELFQYDILNTNLQLNINILNCCKENDVKKIILFSSYRIFPVDIPNIDNEDSLFKNIDFNINENNSGYLLSKKIMNLQIELLKKISNINVICLILPNIFGSYDDFSINGRIVSSIIYKIYLANNNDCDVHINSNEQIEVNLIYINDIIRLIDKCIQDEHIIGNIIILNKNNTIRLYELCSIIKNIMGFKKNIYFNNNEPYIENNIMNVSLHQFHTYFPTFQFTELFSSLKETISYFYSINSNVT